MLAMDAGLAATEDVDRAAAVEDNDGGEGSEG